MSAPKLRFKEFDGDWSNKSLDQISKVFDGTHQTPTYVDSGVKFVSVENINAPYESDKFITEEAFKKDFKNQPRLNDILMTRITAGEIGATAIVNNSEPLAYYVSLALIRPKAEINTSYLNQYIATPQFKKELHKRIIHVAFPKKINLGDINECLVSAPNEIKEQTKIASFLSAVDEKISQLSQKHSLLSQYKQGMMQKLFSQQIRFKADDGSEFGEWEETTLKDCITSIDSGWSPQCESYSTNLNEWGILKTSSVDWKGFNASFNKKLPDHLTPRLELEVQPLDILVTRAGPTDRVGVVSVVPENVRSKLMISDKLIRLKTNQKNNPIFLGISLSSSKCQNQLQSKTSGLAKSQTNISQKILGDVVLKLPSKEEQTKIANFLSSIDQKIEVVAQQIEHAKQWKKGLLQQMFV